MHSHVELASSAGIVFQMACPVHHLIHLQNNGAAAPVCRWLKTTPMQAFAGLGELALFGQTTDHPQSKFKAGFPFVLTGAMQFIETNSFSIFRNAFIVQPTLKQASIL